MSVILRPNPIQKDLPLSVILRPNPMQKDLLLSVILRPNPIPKDLPLSVILRRNPKPKALPLSAICRVYCLLSIPSSDKLAQLFRADTDISCKVKIVTSSLENALKRHHSVYTQKHYFPFVLVSLASTACGQRQFGLPCGTKSATI